MSPARWYRTARLSQPCRNRAERDRVGRRQPRDPGGLRSIQDRGADAARPEVRPDGRPDEVDRDVGGVEPARRRARTSSRNASTSGVTVCRIASRSIGRWQISSMTRSRAFDRVRTRSAVSTTPCFTAMIGLTERSVPMAAWAPLIRPALLEVLEGLEGDVHAHVRCPRLERLGDVRGRARPSAASSTPIRARIPSAIDAPSESTTWISRSGSMSRAIWALLIVPDRVPATWIETIASAPAVERRLVGLLEVARATTRRSSGTARPGRPSAPRTPSADSSIAGTERLGAEGDQQRDDVDALARRPRPGPGPTRNR